MSRLAKKVALGYSSSYILQRLGWTINGCVLLSLLVMDCSMSISGFLSVILDILMKQAKSKKYIFITHIMHFYHKNYCFENNAF